MYHATIDPDACTLTLTERRPDPIPGEGDDQHLPAERQPP